MSNRVAVLNQIAAEVRCVLTSGVTFVGIDGVDGAGKTCFADELATCLPDLEVIRSSVDGFHNPRAIRYEKGKHSPEGFFHDSFDYRQLRESLLDPLSAGGTMRYRTAVFDHRIDQTVDTPTLNARSPSILIVDGIYSSIDPSSPTTGTTRCSLTSIVVSRFAGGSGGMVAMEFPTIRRIRFTIDT